MFARMSCTKLPKYANTRTYNHLFNNNIYIKPKGIQKPPYNGCAQPQIVKECRSSSTFKNVRLIWNNIFGKYLLITNIVGSGVLMVVGDVMAQEIEFRSSEASSKHHYDWPRIGRMFIVGALQGPLHHYVYNWMDKIMPVANIRNVVKKILIDQIFMSPACILIFFYSACYLERKTVSETNDELRKKFWFIYCMDWMLWPGAQYINFRYLDTKYRVTFVNLCTALYNVFMSYMKHDF